MRNQGMLERTALLINAEHIAPVQFLGYGTELRRTVGISPRRWWARAYAKIIDGVSELSLGELQPASR